MMLGSLVAFAFFAIEMNYILLVFYVDCAAMYVNLFSMFNGSGFLSFKKF